MDDTFDPDDSLGPDDVSAPICTSSLVDVAAKSHETIPPINAYQIKPSLQEKFKELPVKEIIRNVVNRTLSGKPYEPEYVKKFTIFIANEVSEKVKQLNMKRYKHIVQVVIGEMKGAGVKSGVRCLWDSDVDGYTTEVFISETLFCLTTVFAVYLY